MLIGEGGAGGMDLPRYLSMQTIKIHFLLYRDSQVEIEGIINRIGNISGCLERQHYPQLPARFWLLVILGPFR